MKKGLLFFTMLYSYFLFGQNYNFNPEIENIISQVNKDSINNIIQNLQDFGTRFCLKDNRKDIANWIKNKYISYGYTNVELDSFFMVKNFNGNIDSTWQYNVVAKIEGTLEPDIYYVIGGHYDSFSSNIDEAPGADDNASGTVAAMEIARIFKQTNYQCRRSIIFIAFAAEELMLFPTLNGEDNKCGSMHWASTAKENKMNIQLMINNDMISYNLTSYNKIRLINPDNHNYTPFFAKDISSFYTNLNLYIENEQTKSDHYPFHENGFKSIFFQEYYFDPNYHTPDDIISNHDMDYCTEVTKISCAMLVHLTSQSPPVFSLKAISGINNIKLRWENLNNIYGYNIYKSEFSDSNFTKINGSPFTDTTFIDYEVEPDKYYYYRVTSLDNQGYESFPSNTAQAMSISFENTILIVDDSHGEILNPPDSITDEFYDQIFNGYDHSDYDAIENGNTIGLSTLGKYKAVLWRVDKYSVSSIFYKCIDELKRYLDAGGQLLLISERISSTFDQNYSWVPMTFGPEDFAYDYLKINELKKNASPRFIGATPYNSEFSPVYIDTNKTSSSYMHHINYVEAIFPINEAHIIFSYDSNYDTSTTEGAYKGLPVGVEYMGNDFKTITLSFPLYYMKVEDAKNLVDSIFKSKFNISGIDETFSGNKLDNYVKIYPNPFQESITIEYYLPQNSNINIELYNAFGNLIKQIKVDNMAKGVHSEKINLKNLSDGAYYGILKTNSFIKPLKFVKL